MRNSYLKCITEEANKAYNEFIHNLPLLFEDWWEPQTIANSNRYYYPDLVLDNVVYDEDSVIISPKSFYDKIIFEDYRIDFDYTVAKRPAVHSKYTIREIAKTLGIAAKDIDKRFHAVYLENKPAPIAAFINYNSLTLEDDEVDSLVLLFAHYGYFLSYITKRKKNKHSSIYVYVYQFEPYYFENDRICIDAPLWHMTKLLYKDLILENGFVPSHQSQMYGYPPRNYFALERNDDLMIGAMYATGKFSKENQGRNTAVLFEINNKKVENIHFFIDPTYWRKRSAVYCYEIVPPDAIAKVEEFPV